MLAHHTEQRNEFVSISTILKYRLRESNVDDVEVCL